MVTIYVLKDPCDGSIRYVGKATNLASRLWNHIAAAKRGDETHKARWIRGLLKMGLRPVIESLEVCSEDIWKERERFWIAHFDGLTNISAGGDSVDVGIPRPSSWSRAISEARKGHPVSGETRALLREANLAKRSTHCKRGHEFTPENTIWMHGGKHRHCRKCQLMLQRESYYRKGHHSMDDYPRAEFCKRGHPLFGDNLRILVRVKNGKEKIEHICRQCVRDRNRECERRARAAGRRANHYKPKPKRDLHKTYCKHGHLMAGDNLQIRIRYRNGIPCEEHVCQACVRERHVKWKERMNDQNSNG